MYVNPFYFFQLNGEIDKMFGTALWLCHAGQRANHWKLYRAAVKIFSGLFHVNGNSFYSVIDVYDEYLMTMMKTYNSEFYEHLQTRLFTNMTGVSYCSQSHDTRHEEANKRAQNMFPGNSLEELDLAFTIVDDIWQLRKESLVSLVLFCSKFGLTHHKNEIKGVAKKTSHFDFLFFQYLSFCKSDHYNFCVYPP